ncbi:MAG: hypothetical protein IKX93_07965, partial [Bacteroidaceae bacterium]|nr:hypothetical protein [Bacteroidaceae bacterium]
NHSNNFDVSFHLKRPEEQGFDTLVFTLGYPKADYTERRLEFKNPKIMSIKKLFQLSILNFQLK